MRRRSLSLLFALEIAGANAHPATPVEVDWIRRNAVVVDTVEAGHGFADIQALKPLIGDARIVALGEPTHGSREVFQMKHRLLEFLAGELGFTIFSIEANMPEAFSVGRYVLDGDGDPRALIRGMYFWTWSTEEVHQMVRWMRTHNLEAAANPRASRVRFTGFDIQTPDVAAEIVQSFVAANDGAFLPTVREAARAARGAVERVAPASVSRRARFQWSAPAAERCCIAAGSRRRTSRTASRACGGDVTSATSPGPSTTCRIGRRAARPTGSGSRS